MLTAHEIREQLQAELSKIYLPGTTLNCWQWLQENITIPKEESIDNHGPYDTALTFYVCRIMEFLTNAGEKELIIRKSAQLGITLAYILMICFLAAVSPVHVLFAMHSAKKAKEISTRIQQIIKANATLEHVFTDAGEEDMQNLLIRLKGMFVLLTGSGSAGDFGSTSVGLVILDELDRHIPAPNQQANTIDLARDRIKQVEHGKFIAGGTPVMWEGETNQNYLTGTREEAYVPCPFCNHFQPIRWERIKFDHCKNLVGEWDYNRLLYETYYECETPGCSIPERRITEKHKRRMFACARWQVTNHGKDEWKPFPGRASIWINDLYSQRAQTTWGHLAMKWVDAQGSPSKIRSFFNETLGLPQRETKLETKQDDIYRLTGGYEHGCMPVSPALNDQGAAIFVLSDVQAVERKWVKVGITYDGQIYVIDYGRCLTYDELLVAADTPVWIGFKHPHADDIEAARVAATAEHRPFLDVLRERIPGEWHTASAGLIDEGHETNKVREFCLSTADPHTGIPRFFPVKGVARTTAGDTLVNEVSNKFSVDGQFITVYHFADDDVKQELYVGRIGDFDRIKRGISQTPRLWLPAHPETDFVKELCQEHRGRVFKRGRIAWEWLKPKDDNDWGDALKYAIVMWHVVKDLYPAPPKAEAA